MALTDEELVQTINGIETDAEEVHGGLLEQIQANSFEQYSGQLYGNEREGFSSVVTREVFETVESMLTYIMKVYFSGDRVVQFDPEGVEDVQLAQQETDYTNYVFFRQNPGFSIAQDVVRDALICKVGITKTWYDESQAFEKDMYENRTLEEVQTLIALNDAELVELVEVPQGDATDTTEETVLYDCTIKVKKNPGRIKTVGIPPEEFKVDKNATCLDDAKLTMHERPMTSSELTEMGLDVSEIKFGEVQDTTSHLKRVRNNVDGNVQNPSALSNDDSQKEVLVKECYVWVDQDNDGVSELWQVFVADGKVIHKEEVDSHPFNYWTPIKLAHKFHGLSAADITADLQLVQTTLFRNMLDNQYLANNGRYKVVEDQVDLTELMRSTPGGWVTMASLDSLQELQYNQLPPQAFEMLNQVDSFIEKRTGISDRSRGTDPDLLASNSKAGAVSQAVSLSEQRLEMIARNFGEMWFAPLMKRIRDLTMKYDPSLKKFLLRNEFVSTNPNEWKTNRNMSVTVGLGNGNKTEKLFHLQQVSQAQAMALQQGAMGQLLTMDHVYNLQEDIVELVNKQGRGRYWMNPQEAPPPPEPGPDFDQQIKLKELQLKEQEQQIKVAEIQQESAIEAAKVQLEAERLGMEKEELEVDTIMKHAEFELERELGRPTRIGND